MLYAAIDFQVGVVHFMCMYIKVLKHSVLLTNFKCFVLINVFPHTKTFYDFFLVKEPLMQAAS